MVRAGLPPSRKEAERIHELLSECVVADPGNTVYLDALLMHLRSLRQLPRSWWSFLRISTYAVRGYIHPYDLLRPDVFRAYLQDLKTIAADDYSRMLRALATECYVHDFPEAEIRYLREALHFAPDDHKALQQLARALVTQGRFEEARSTVMRLKELPGDPHEVGYLLTILNGPESQRISRKEVLSSSEERYSAPQLLALATQYAELHQFDEAEAVAAKALSLSGGDLAIREQVEEISLARLKNNVAIARRLVEHEPSPAHQQTLRRWEEEFGRLELATLHARSERFPRDAGLKLEVAIRLKRAGNYSGAIQRLEEIAADHSLRPNVLIELGECWQHLRQFDKALGLYTQAIAAAEQLNQPELQKLALYRAGSLAAPLQRTQEANAWFQRLVALDPDFKDARQRLLALENQRGS
jgi:tetratricopeptide (TPR) repeat protein